MSDVVTLANESEAKGGATLALAGMNDGFLGTGYSTSVELSFIALAAICAWVIYETGRYFLAGTGIAERVAAKLGLGDD